jgi:hypothetical protein
MTQPSEVDRRMTFLVARANADGVKPNEYVRRAIQSAVQRGNIFIQEGDGFIVMGYDGFDHGFFPCGSAGTAERAREIAQAKIDEEHLYSEDDGIDERTGVERVSSIATTFHIFTSEGFPVPLTDSEPVPTRKE